MSLTHLTKEQALAEIKATKQANVKSRETRARLRGYSNSKVYILALQDYADSYKSKPVKDKSKAASIPKAPKKGKNNIFIIDVLDKSSSMNMGTVSIQRFGQPRQTRMSMALKALNLGLDNLKKEEAELGVNYMYTLVEFNQSIVVSPTIPVKQRPEVYVTPSGSTALNDAIGEAISHAIKVKRPMDKALINIYTDGEENCSKKYNKSSIKEYIAEAESQGITVTFIGTERDTFNAIKDFGLDIGNTVSYDGTAEGLGQTMSMTSDARTEYSKKVVAGEDVSRGFYKKFKK